MRNATKGRGRRFGMVWAAATLAALTMMVTALASASANAGMTTYDVKFTVHTFLVGSGGAPAPVDPVIGEVHVTLDPTVAVLNSTANITLKNLNIALGSAISFSYDPNLNGGFLEIGGINAGAGVIIFNPSTNDFWLQIKDFQTAPAFNQMGYTQTSVSNDNLFYTLNQTGTADVTPIIPGAVPEPSALTLAGLGGLTLSLSLAFFGRRRRT